MTDELDKVIRELEEAEANAIEEAIGQLVAAGFSTADMEMRHLCGHLYRELWVKGTCAFSSEMYFDDRNRTMNYKLEPYPAEPRLRTDGDDQQRN